MAALSVLAQPRPAFSRASGLSSSTSIPAAGPCVAQQRRRQPLARPPAAAAGQEAWSSSGSLPGLGLAAAAVVLLAAPQAQAFDAAATFGKSCAGCHAGGGNVIRREATLQLADLQKFGLAEVEPLFNVIYSGKNSMPGFGEGCAPRGACTFGPRLSDDDIRQLADYVLAQATAGWPAAEAQ